MRALYLLESRDLSPRVPEEMLCLVRQERREGPLDCCLGFQHWISSKQQEKHVALRGRFYPQARNNPAMAVWTITMALAMVAWQPNGALLRPPSPQLPYLRQLPCRARPPQLQLFDLSTLAPQPPAPGAVPVDIAVTGVNSRCISASILIDAHPSKVWAILTGEWRIYPASA
jgi:hypothetical protein